ncbi:hypothetical protein BKA63DRAFT_488861 [Paraphoma chrysanthemicola]|nr:hypothetical protein BKA63DRAFT_488861 [Paraphoma chrysanthemicola]
MCSEDESRSMWVEVKGPSRHSGKTSDWLSGDVENVSSEPFGRCANLPPSQSKPYCRSRSPTLSIIIGTTPSTLPPQCIVWWLNMGLGMIRPDAAAVMPPKPRPIPNTLRICTCEILNVGPRGAMDRTCIGVMRESRSSRNHQILATPTNERTHGPCARRFGHCSDVVHEGLIHEGRSANDGYAIIYRYNIPAPERRQTKLGGIIISRLQQLQEQCSPHQESRGVGAHCTSWAVRVSRGTRLTLPCSRTQAPTRGNDRKGAIIANEDHPSPPSCQLILRSPQSEESHANGATLGALPYGGPIPRSEA